MKYPIGIQAFDNIIEDGFVYVDKTDILICIFSTSPTRKFARDSSMCLPLWASTSRLLQAPLMNMK